MTNGIPGGLMGGYPLGHFTDIPGAIMCGGKPTPGDLAKVQEFQAALSQPTPHLTRIAMIEMLAADGDADAEAALERHRMRCFECWPTEDGWADEECHRVSGEVECTMCTRPYWKHRQVTPEVPTLVRACDGRLLKL